MNLAFISVFELPSNFTVCPCFGVDCWTHTSLLVACKLLHENSLSSFSVQLQWVSSVWSAWLLLDLLLSMALGESCSYYSSGCCVPVGSVCWLCWKEGVQNLLPLAQHWLSRFLLVITSQACCHLHNIVGSMEMCAVWKQALRVTIWLSDVWRIQHKVCERTRVEVNRDFIIHTLWL